MPAPYEPTQRILLLRRGLVFPGAPGDRLPEPLLQAVDLQLSELGYALSTRLRERLARLSMDELARVQGWIFESLDANLGGDRRHIPLFANFPHDVPRDTEALWWRKFLAYYLQAPDQPCLFCRRVGTTHVLSPCHDVVCDHCFDGANYTACPVCEHHVDRGSPFFTPADLPADARPREPIAFKLLDLGTDLEAAVREVFVALCERRQAMSPADREDLAALVADQASRVPAWLPPAVPVRENAAIVFATLARHGEPEAVLAAAAPYLKTATDLLRFLAVYSGAEPTLDGQDGLRPFPGGERLIGRVMRFRVAKLPRKLRRAVLQALERIGFETLAEDMLRHRSYWVWLGEFLHPHEYAGRFPQVARAFAVVRKRAPDGTKAPPFRTWASRVEAALAARDGQAVARLLGARPGELARRLDYALRTVAAEPPARQAIVEAFIAHLPAYGTPVLLTLRHLLPTRAAQVPVRVYWPKGALARGVVARDTRRPLAASVIETLVGAIEGELLRRFAALPPIEAAIVDAPLAAIPVPFNERTAARSAIALPRGSRVVIPPGKLMRLFLHWCQPDVPDTDTDLDLSVGFFDANWGYQGVCSYYQLRCPEGEGPAIAKSAGDLRDAPFPDGATEFIDLDVAAARAAGMRYAVAVVNAYAGLTFGALERAFAGLMLRDDPEGAHFDPRTVALKFALAGEHGIYLPFVVDLEAGVLHWLDVHARGEFQFNNVEYSKRAIHKVCPPLMGYFASGVRPSMYDLALLHAAARARRVYVRDGGARCFERDGEDARTFLVRLRAGRDGAPAALPGAEAHGVWAALHTGDLDLPDGSPRYCLFPGRVTGTLAAADVLGG